MATKPRLIYANHWRDGTMLTPSSEDPQHPASDTQIDTLSMYWKASSTEQTVTIPINQGATPGAVDFVAIFAHNIEATGVVITLEGATNAAFDEGFVTRTITHNATNIFQFVTTFTKQYVRIKLYRAAGVFPTLPQIATIVCGAYFEPNRNFTIPYSQGIEDYSEIELSDSVILFDQEKPRLKTWLLPFRGLNDESKVKVLALMDECGIHRAFVIVFDSDNPNTDSHLVRLEELVSPENQHVDYWNWELAIKEVK